MNKCLAILEYYAFYISYKNAKFTRINGRTNLKYFMQTQLLLFYKDTAKVSSLPCEEEDTNTVD